MCAHVRAAPAAPPAPLPRRRPPASCAPRTTRSPSRGHSPTHQPAESSFHHHLAQLSHTAQHHMHVRAMAGVDHAPPATPPSTPVGTISAQHPPPPLSPTALDLHASGPLSPPLSPHLGVPASMAVLQQPSAATATVSATVIGTVNDMPHTATVSGSGATAGTSGGTSNGGGGGGTGGGRSGNAGAGGGSGGTGCDGNGGPTPPPGSGPQVANGPPQPHPPPSSISGVGTNLGDNINRMTRMLRLPWVRQYMLASSLSTDVGVLSNPLGMQAAVVCDSVDDHQTAGSFGQRFLLVPAFGADGLSVGACVTQHSVRKHPLHQKEIFAADIRLGRWVRDDATGEWLVLTRSEVDNITRLMWIGSLKSTSRERITITCLSDVFDTGDIARSVLFQCVDTEYRPCPLCGAAPGVCGGCTLPVLRPRHPLDHGTSSANLMAVGGGHWSGQVKVTVYGQDGLRPMLPSSTPFAHRCKYNQDEQLALSLQGLAITERLQASALPVPQPISTDMRDIQQLSILCPDLMPPPNSGSAPLAIAAPPASSAPSSSDSAEDSPAPASSGMTATNVSTATMAGSAPGVSSVVSASAPANVSSSMFEQLSSLCFTHDQGSSPGGNVSHLQHPNVPALPPVPQQADVDYLRKHPELSMAAAHMSGTPLPFEDPAGMAGVTYGASPSAEGFVNAATTPVLPAFLGGSDAAAAVMVGHVGMPSHGVHSTAAALARAQARRVPPTASASTGRGSTGGANHRLQLTDKERRAEERRVKNRIAAARSNARAREALERMRSDIANNQARIVELTKHHESLLLENTQLKEKLTGSFV